MKLSGPKFIRHCSVFTVCSLVAFSSPLLAEEGNGDLARPEIIVYASTGIANESAFPGEVRNILEVAELPVQKTRLILLAQTEEEINDPLESVNRAIFSFNEVIMDGFFRPVANTYNEQVPAGARLSVSNFLDNLSAPVTFANDILQFEIKRAGETFVRFFLNSTIGIFGLADVAGESGLVDHNEDFGQTLGAWGVGEGMYLVLPIFGPSSPRDAIGKMVVDPFFDPFGAWISNTERDNLSYAKTGMSGVDEYAGVVDELDQIRKTSIDYYAAIRSLYRQKRKAEISNGNEYDLPPIPEIGYDIQLDDLDQSIAGSVN